MTLDELRIVYNAVLLAFEVPQLRDREKEKLKDAKRIMDREIKQFNIGVILDLDKM